jgi:hypothetical protein
MNPITPRFFRLEAAVMVGVWLLYVQYGHRFANWRRLRKFLHFFFILAFAEIGACGLRVTIDLVFGTSSFLETFRQANLLCLPPGLMCWLAGAYALAGAVFLVAVMFLGELNLKRRGIFFVLVCPCTLLYPLIMANLTQTAGFISKSSPWSVVGLFGAFVALAAMGIAFFRSNPQSGASGNQPISSEANRTSVAAAPRRSP